MNTKLWGGAVRLQTIRFLAWLFIGTCAAFGQTADIYVRSGATPAAPYDTWATAFTDIQSAFDHAASNGALTNRIHLAGENLAAAPGGGNAFVYRLRNVTNIIVRGGYEADPGLTPGAHPGTNNPSLWPSTLARASGAARVVQLEGLENVRFESLIIRDGYQTFSSGTQYGGGVLISGCDDVVFADCRILDNQLLSTSTAITYGGGLAVTDNSTVILEDTLVADNLAGRLSGTGSHNAYGGGASIDGTSRLRVLRSIVRNNEARGRYGSSIGAGGGFFVATGGRLDVSETVIRDNEATWIASACNSEGGAIYNAGTLTLRNVLLAGNRSTTAHSDGIYLHGGTALIVNSTIADNDDIGIRYNAGTVAITNSIVWGHTSYDLRDFPVGANDLWPDVWYSFVGDPRNDGFQGCITVDPLFADRTHYHLQSTQGHYTNGYFRGGSWAMAAVDSPLIDRGHPDSDWSREPAPNGAWINLGAYGNTEVAAKSLNAQAAPAVSNPGAMAWGHRTVNLRGVVTAGGDLPLVTFDFWEIGNAATTTVSAGHADGVVLTRVTDLTPGTDYAYRVNASNSVGVSVSSDSAFSTHPVPSVFYVSTNGNHTSGTSWTTAFRDLDTALAVAEPGDTFYIAGGTFSVPARFPDGYVWAIRNLSELTFRGGFSADGDAELPGPRDPEATPTVLERAASGADGRVLLLEGLSNVRFQGLTIRGGEFTGSGTRHGGGVYLSDCTDVVFDGCRILDNSMRSTATATLHGGGMALVGSAVTLTNSVIAGNFTGWISGTGSHNGYGGGASVDGTSRLTVRRSHVYDNEAKGRLSPNIGAGAGFYVGSGGVLDVHETVIRNNAATRDGTADSHGGAIYNAGTLTLRNAVVAGNQSTTAHSDGIYLHGGAASIINCTVADNFDVGIRYNAGTVAITNAIIRGHTAFDLRDFPTDGSGFWPAVWYSCIEDDRNDGFQGSLSVDPLFADRTYYHLKSTVGYYAGGYFDGGDWATADADSPLIDRGHPDLDFSREPEPRGSGINIGAYGNTAVASKSLGAQSAPTVVNTGAQLWGRRTVRLAGDVTDSGGELPLVTFEYWPADLAVTSTVSVGYADGVVLADVSGLTPGTDYQYRIVAANSVGAAFSSVEAFSTHPVPSVFYVSTNGNHSAGTSWSTAYRDVPSALSVVESGDTVLLAGHTFVKAVGIADDFVFRIENLTNVVFRGGYAATGDVELPGPRDPEVTPTVLERATSGAIGRVLHLK